MEKKSDKKEKKKHHHHHHHDKDKGDGKEKENKGEGKDSSPPEKIEDAKVKMIHLSDYEMGETLGTGSFGRVKIAKNKKTGEYIAMKIMK